MQVEPQAAQALLMIRPTRFCFNQETAVDNAFQHQSNLSDDEMQQKALEEFDKYVALAKSKGIEVYWFQDTYEPHTPDSIFPNNWVSFHADGTIILYPMEAEDRREERRQDILDDLEVKHKFKVSRVIDITKEEESGRYLEGTGSIVFDYINKIAYACTSRRTNLEVLHLVADRLGYKVHAFHSVDNDGHKIYHTNVMMCLGEKFAMVWADSIRDKKERESLINSLEETRHEIVYLNYDQITSFAGNALEVSNGKGEKFLVIAKKGYDSLTAEQISTLEKYVEILPIDLDIIEGAEGGSARCMVADIRLPRRE